MRCTQDVYMRSVHEMYMRCCLHAGAQAEQTGHMQPLSTDVAMQRRLHCLGSVTLLQVVEQNGQWYCEYDGKTYPSMVRRYVTTLRCTDNTAELTINAFNEQVSLSVWPSQSVWLAV